MTTIAESRRGDLAGARDRRTGGRRRPARAHRTGPDNGHTAGPGPPTYPN